jgi:hypothetical protein
MANGRWRKWREGNGKWQVAEGSGEATHDERQMAGGKWQWRSNTWQAANGKWQECVWRKYGRVRKKNGGKERCGISLVHLRGVAWDSYLIKFPISDRVFSVLDGIIELLSQRTEEIVLYQFDVKPLVTLEGIEPLPTNAALILHQSLLAILLPLPWVNLEVEEEGSKGGSMSGRPQPRFGHEMKHNVLSVKHFFPTEVLVVSDVFGGPQC